MIKGQTTMDNDAPGKSVGKTIIQMLGGAAFGFVAIFAFDKLVGIKAAVEGSSGPALFALVIAVIFSLVAAIVFAMSFSRKLFTYNRIYEDMEAEEYDGQRPILRWSALGLAAYAAALFVLALAPNGSPQPTFFAAVMIAMVVQFACSFYLWKHYDELWRQATKDACAISFCIIEVVVFIWAAAAIFGLGVTFHPLAVVVTSMAIYTAVTVLLVARKGMTQ